MSYSGNILNIVGFAPHEWSENSIEWYKLQDWFDNFKDSWTKEKKVRRKLMKLALTHPSWTIDLHCDGRPIYIQVRASSQIVEDEDEADRISRCHNKMYPLDFCCYVEELDYQVVGHRSEALPLKVDWCIETKEKVKLTVLEEDNN